MTTYFTSDPHYGHRKVAGLRGFGTPDNPDTDLHDATLMERWTRVVHPSDIVWILGDLSGGSRLGTENALTRIAQLPGRKRLITGNHDPVHPMHRDAWKWTARFAEVFEFVTPFARIRAHGVEVMLSHFPYARDRDTPRYMQYRLRDEGLPLLHGHTHGSEQLTLSERAAGTRREVHVGADAWNMTPVSDAEVYSLLVTYL